MHYLTIQWFIITSDKIAEWDTTTSHASTKTKAGVKNKNVSYWILNRLNYLNTKICK